MSLLSLRGGVAAAEIMPIFYEIATLVNSLAMTGAETPLKAIKMKARNLFELSNIRQRLLFA
ncbi:MAG: hypothetical protein IJX98_01760 [Clostridia bacterium]|nr:hypothetical protein [Clostridia bacterium]